MFKKLTTNLENLFTMTQKHNKHVQPIREVIRGERAATDLADMGITLEFIDGTWHIMAPHLEPVKLQISDIAHGLVKYRSVPKDLQKWAGLLLCGSGFIDLSDCEIQTGWDLLLNALWDAMDTGAFSDSALHLAEELAK